MTRTMKKSLETNLMINQTTNAIEAVNVTFLGCTEFSRFSLLQMATTHPKRVAIVVTNTSQIGNKNLGWSLPEVAHGFYFFSAH